MRIIKYNSKYENDVKDLLVQLQEHIVALDNWNLNIMTPEYREIYFKRMIKMCEGGVVLVAVENERAIGLISGNVIKCDEEDKVFYKCPKSCEIYELIVSHNTRHGGVGGKLIEKIEDYFKKLGCEYCHVGVFEPNEMAKSFYDKHGYITRMRSLSKRL